MRGAGPRAGLARTPVLAGGFALLAALSIAVGNDSRRAGAAVPPPAHHPYFGYNEVWSGDPSRVRRAARGGSDIARAVISWIEVEPEPGDRHWRSFDLAYERILAAGMRPLWVLADAPCWARGVTQDVCQRQGVLGRPPDPAHEPDFARFAAMVAERYPLAVGIETWNEPNLDLFWRPRPDAARAATMTALIDRSVAEVDPDMPVILGGLAPVLERDEEDGTIYAEFIRRAYAAVGPDHWDAVAIHPFPRFERSRHYLRTIRGHLRRLRAALAASSVAGTPIWVTEIGLTTAGNRPYRPPEQAQGLTRIYRLLAGMDDVPAVLVHRLFDQPRSAWIAESGWGVIRRSGRPKPAFCALARERGAECGGRR